VEIVTLRHAAFGPTREARLTSPAGHASAAVRGPAVLSLADAAMRVETGWTAVPHPAGGWMMERTT
jgi:uncharacterized membrane-anchored protein